MLGWWLLLLAAAPPALAAGAPRAPVVALHEALLGIMREAATLGFEGRRARIAPVLERSFDLPFITRLVLGRHWSGLDAAARQRLVAAFSALTAATYAARFDGYAGERFEVLEERPLKRGRRLVRSVLIGGDGTRVRLDYVVREGAEGWRIVNVLADGVSELAIKRADYDKVMRSEGVDALIARIVAQTEGYARRSER